VVRPINASTIINRSISHHSGKFLIDAAFVNETSTRVAGQIIKNRADDAIYANKKI
jgi:hypothetical protein